MSISKRSNLHIKYIFFLIPTVLGLLNFIYKFDWVISDTETNIGFFIIQILIVLSLYYCHFYSFPLIDKLNDISIRPSAEISKGVGEKLANKAVSLAQHAVKVCKKLWFTVLTGWLILYFFLLINGIGLIPIDNDTKNFVLRNLNYIDTVQMLFFYALFSHSDPNINLKSIIKKSSIALCAIFFICFFDLITFLIFESNWLSIILTITSAIFSSLCFLLFFSRLDSILLQFNKFILAAIILYGIYQAIYPLLFSNLFFDKEVLIFLNVIGFCLAFIGKISLALIFSKKEYLERLIYYFSSIYILGPITSASLSIVHTLYSPKKVKL